NRLDDPVVHRLDHQRPLKPHGRAELRLDRVREPRAARCRGEVEAVPPLDPGRVDADPPGAAVPAFRAEAKRSLPEPGDAGNERPRVDAFGVVPPAPQHVPREHVLGCARPGALEPGTDALGSMREVAGVLVLHRILLTIRNRMVSSMYPAAAALSIRYRM